MVKTILDSNEERAEIRARCKRLEEFTKKEFRDLKIEDSDGRSFNIVDPRIRTPFSLVGSVNVVKNRVTLLEDSQYGKMLGFARELERETGEEWTYDATRMAYSKHKYLIDTYGKE